MKKLTTIWLCLALAAVLTACATSNTQPSVAESTPAAQTPVTESTPAAPQTAPAESAPAEPQAAPAESAPAEPQTPPAESAPAEQPPAPESAPTSVQTEETISRDRAIELALTEAGFTKEEVRDLEAELDRERGGLVWEVDFESGKLEYSYDINATTEEIVKVERDRD